MIGALVQHGNRQQGRKIAQALEKAAIFLRFSPEHPPNGYRGLRAPQNCCTIRSWIGAKSRLN